MTGPARAQRADARSNRAAILDAAQEVFGAGGESASTEEVARRAGVGIATVFRHFPTKSELLLEVLVQRFGRLRERAVALAADPDPGHALFTMFTEVVSDAPGKIAIADALMDTGGATGRAEQASREFSEAVSVLLRRAQEAGAVRGDVGLPEFSVLMVGMSRYGAEARLDPDVRTQALRVIFDGLAAPRGGEGGPAA